MTIAYRHFVGVATAALLAFAPAVAAPPARLSAAEIGLVVNTADPYSVEVGDYYARRRGLVPEQVLRVELPTGAALGEQDFERLQRAIDERFGARTQALALAWTMPYAVGCQSIGGALAVGVDAELCRNSCAASRPSPYFGSRSARPWSDHGLRPVMQLAAPGVAAAKAMIDRGVAADGSLVRVRRAPVTALFVATDDPARRVRMALYPPPGPVRAAGVDVRIGPPEAIARLPRLVLVQTGAAKLELPAVVDWVPGALADHLTSTGGALAGGHGQSTVLEWIAAGATASHGSVSEPCNHLQKFPHPQVLLQAYTQGATAVEAYWKSVAWPSQSLFVGEPLAAPFAPPSTPDAAR